MINHYIINNRRTEPSLIHIIYLRARYRPSSTVGVKEKGVTPLFFSHLSAPLSRAILGQHRRRRRRGTRTLHTHTQGRVCKSVNKSRKIRSNLYLLY